MHPEAAQFLTKFASVCPHFFRNKKVIDIGSGDINGNNRCLFTDCAYVGVDVVAAPNVDLVCKGKDIPLSMGPVDVVVSSECFEHDNQVAQTLVRILQLLGNGALFLFTCAGVDRPEHGTRRSDGCSSYSLKLDFNHRQEWYPNYYQNVTMNHVFEMLDIQRYFSVFHLEYNRSSYDLYGYGIRNDTPYVPPTTAWLDAIFNRYPTDKGPTFHGYSRQYSSLLSRFRLQNIRILEIGVWNGASLRAWRDAFLNAYSVVGIDSTPACKQFQSPDDGIWVEIGDQSDSNFLRAVSEKHGPFDLIIDDGSHRNDHVIISFEALFPLLNDNGVYIVEDTICYKSDAHVVSGAHPHHLEYFWGLTRHLNQWRRDDAHSGTRDNCIDPFKIEKKTMDPIEQGLDRIEFGTSYIACTKLVRTHWVPS